MKSIHRSWLVCLGGSLTLFTAMGLGVNVFSAYHPTIIATYGFTNAQGSLITTVRSLFSILAMLSVGGLVDRLGLRITMGLGMLCSVLSCLVFGLATTFPTYCLGGVLAGLSYAWAGMIPLSYVIARWFSIRRGYALGLSSAASGIATIIAPTPIAYSIETFGLSTTFFLEAAFMLLLTALVVLLVRDSPEELGLLPFGAEETSGEIVRPEKTSTIPSTSWALVLCAAFLAGAPAGTGFSHLIVLYSSVGFSEYQITLLLTYVGIVIMAGKIFYGQISDVLGGFRSNFLVFGILILGIIACCLAPTGSILLAVVAATGVPMGLSLSIALSVWVFDLSTTAQYEHRMRLSTVAFMLGNLAFGPTPGILADITGSYVPAYLIFSCAGILSMAIIQLIYIRHPVK